jgi:hypothetical protein
VPGLSSRLLVTLSFNGRQDALYKFEQFCVILAPDSAVHKRLGFGYKQSMGHTFKREIRPVTELRELGNEFGVKNESGKGVGRKC